METTVARVALFAALIAALGLIPQITIPFAGGVPITAQTLGVMLAGLILGPWRGAAAVLVFIAVVALGAPLLAGGRGGLGVFVGPTVGFLVGWPVAAIVIGLLYRAFAAMGPMLSGILASAIGGIVVLYGFGVVGLSLITQMSLLKAVTVVLIFIPGDILKAILAAFLNREVRRARPSLAD
ncbi:biotin transporter BioY [Futiania mangrovi]|uniref:Biotin transporter n=1 Tax=Futiania mangrovi TaxID=2959716 RepID=A0A9J6PJC6_9PROT|nr:biotin transporter BioY [Futiania mangrovii]MCP1337920.1 biotin transporter BioY [Futiania mangrovii]